jgi:predicted metal-dependent peptidase
MASKLMFNLTPKERIVKAKIRLQEKRPFFAYLLLHMFDKEVNNKSVLTMGVNKYDRLLYNAKFVESLNDEFLSSCICHETLHVALCHVWRCSGDRDRMVWNLAADSVINSMLKADGFELPVGCIIPDKDDNLVIDGQLLCQSVSQKAVEQVYDEIVSVLSKMPKGGKDGKGKGKGSGKEDKDGDGTSGYGEMSGDLMPDNMDGAGENGKDEDGNVKDGKMSEQADAMERKWKKIMAEAASVARMRGKLPAGMERFIDNLLEPKVNWRNLLHRYVSRAMPFDYTWKYPSKKSFATGVYMPNVLRENVDIIVSIDTSGCFVGDTLIYTDNGIKEIKNITPLYDKIVNSDFKKCKIDDTKNKFIYENNKIIDIITKSGKRIQCTPNHNIFVCNKGKIMEKRADELTTNDFLISSKKIDYPQREIKLPFITYLSKHLATPKQRIDILELSKKHSGYEIAKILNIGSYRVYNVLKEHKYVRKHPILPENIDRPFAELLGYICGDGNKSITKTCCYLQMTDKSVENLEYYQKIANKFNIHSVIKIKERKRLKLNSKEFTLYINDNFGEIICRSPVRSVPNIISMANDDILKGFIRGFFDAEGHIGEHNIGFDSTSEKLMRQIQMMLERLGIYSYLENRITPVRMINGNKIKETKFFRLLVSGLDNVRKFYDEIGVTRSDKTDKILNYLNSRKINLNRVNKKYNDNLVLEKISKINEKILMEKIPVYDLEVSNDHNYFANGILVHNSIGQEELTEFMSEIVGIAKSTANLKMTVLVCDAEIHETYEVRNGNIPMLLAMKMTGGGGTSHKNVVDYVNDKHRDAVLVIAFTDGYSDIQNEFPRLKCRNRIIMLSKRSVDSDELSEFGNVIKMNEAN